MSPERAFLSAVRDAALADADVQTVLGARIYDDHPPDPVFPYMTIGRIESRSADSALTQALEHSATLHVWSRNGGRAEALDAVHALRAALHDQDIAITGRNLVLLLATFVDVFRAGDGRTTHGVLRLRAITQ